MTVVAPSRKQHMNQQHINQQDFQRLFERAVAHRSRELFRRDRMERANRHLGIAMKPRMEVFDDPGSRTITAQVEVPGMKTNDVSLQIRQDRLVVSGERRPTFAVGERREFYDTSMESAAENEVEGERGEDGDQSSPPPTSRSKFPVQELKYGKFIREINIPTGLQVNEISASLVDGILTITWPRISAAEEARSVEVD